MCGLAVVYSYHYAAPGVDLEELRQIRDSMTVRGPDGFGEWVSKDRRVALGHRRLAIIDLSQNGAQPMKNSDESLAVSFNGEIYNYHELRSDLEKKGRIFKSRSDTEVLLHLYAEKGETMVHDLRGMFAFAIWDNKRRALFLARDPYGIKPLYYADDGWTVRVASQVKALLQSKRVSKNAEPAGIVGFFLTGSVPEPFTTFQEIRQLPAGSFMWIDETGPSLPKKYFSIARVYLEAAENKQAWSGEDLLKNIREALKKSVHYHLVADVPAGLFLSAGIDSNAILALASEDRKELRAVTLAFEEFEGDERNELPLARMTTARYGVQHHARVLSKPEFKRGMERFLESMDQPSTDGINAYFVSLAAKEMGLKVVLSGLGGDELFGGYPSFTDIPKIVKASAIVSKIPFVPDAWRYLYSTAHFLLGLPYPKISGVFKYGGDYEGAYFLRRGIFMPWELKGVLKDELLHESLKRLKLQKLIADTLEPDPKTPFARVATLESSFYMRNQLLRDADWAGMAHSLEIRTPWVDSELLKALAPLLVSVGSQNRKRFLADSVGNRLPEEVVKRKKTGFSVPVEQWLKDEESIGEWQNIPKLTNPHCHWSRRWAYTIYKRMIE